MGILSWLFSEPPQEGGGQIGAEIDRVFAAKIAALQAENARLREALEPFAKCADDLDGDQDVARVPDNEWAKFRLLASDYRRARAALNQDRGA